MTSDKTQSLATLTQQFGLPGYLDFELLGEGLIAAGIKHPAANARISLQGGHVLDWQPLTQREPVLWMSREARFAPGKSIRGGIPVCWPWFGPHADGPALPAHGFARTAAWELVGTALEHDTVRLDLRLIPEPGTPGWPHASVLHLSIRIGASLRLTLTTQNQDVHPWILGEALHTYFRISDIANISVAGLDGVAYWDTVGTVRQCRQQGAIRFVGETDRVYVNSAESCVIEDVGLKRRIRIAKSGSQTTVVWNPWTDKANRMGDLGQPDGWREFVCVESANAWDNCLTLAPGEQHALQVEYSVEDMA